MNEASPPEPEQSATSAPVADVTALTADEIARIGTLLEEKAPGASKCPVCLPGRFSLVQHLVVPPVYYQQSFMIGASYPSVMVVCTHCGFARLHNAIVLGFLNADGGRG